MRLRSFLRVDSKGFLLIEDVLAEDLATKYGTPLFVISKGILLDNYKRILTAFQSAYPKSSLFYSIKTNYNSALCKILKAAGAGAEVFSELDLQVALNAGFSPNKIIYNNPCKSIEDLLRVMQKDLMLFNLDSLSEIHAISKVATKLEKNIEIGLRIDPTNNEKLKLGLTSKEASNLVRSLSKNPFLKLKSISFHLGTQMTDVSRYIDALRQALCLVSYIREKYNVEVEKIDIGGGFPSAALLSTEVVPSIEGFALSIIQSLKEQIEDKKLHDLELLIEPGRYLVNDAVTCLGKILNLKILKSRLWAFTNLGLNILPNLNSARYIVVPAKGFFNKFSQDVTLVGPLSMEHDVFTDHRFSSVREGDTVVVLNCGAYTMSLANQFCYPRPAVVLVDSAIDKIVRKRELLEDVIEKEL